MAEDNRRTTSEVGRKAEVFDRPRSSMMFSGKNKLLYWIVAIVALLIIAILLASM